jgi:hypothetical protein
VVAVSFPSVPSVAFPEGSLQSQRRYRLVDSFGDPHPVLDDLYESPESAWSEAVAWWKEQCGPEPGPMPIGMEVSTSCGSWRTLRHPCG